MKSILQIRFLRVGRSWLYTAGLAGFAACGLVCDVLLGFHGRSQEDLGTIPRTPNYHRVCPYNISTCSIYPKNPKWSQEAGSNPSFKSAATAIHRLQSPYITLMNFENTTISHGMSGTMLGKWWERVHRKPPNIGAVLIRKGFWGVLYSNHNKEPAPPNPILIIKAPM